MNVNEFITDLRAQVSEYGHRAQRRDGKYMEAFHVTGTFGWEWPAMWGEFPLREPMLSRLDRRMLKEQAVALWNGCTDMEGPTTRKCFAHSQTMDCPIGFGAQMDQSTGTLRCWMPFRSVDLDRKFTDDVWTGIWIADAIAQKCFVDGGLVKVRFDLFNAHYKVDA